MENFVGLLQIHEFDSLAEKPDNGRFADGLTDVCSGADDAYDPLKNLFDHLRLLAAALKQALDPRKLTTIERVQ
ncbi:MAG: hypothetical protein AABZ60_16945 [Planctomycetota bacterium]